MSNYIMEFNHIFSNEFCQTIIKRRENSEINNYRDICFWKDKQINLEWHDLINELEIKVRPCIQKYLTAFLNCLSIDNIELSGFGLVKQPAGCFDSLHYDIELIESEDRLRLRPFVCLVYLNHLDFSGGQLIFPVQKQVVSPMQGKVVIFPSSYLFPHQVAPIAGGDRFFLRLNYMFSKNLHDNDLDHFDIETDGVQKYL